MFYNRSHISIRESTHLAVELEEKICRIRVLRARLTNTRLSIACKVLCKPDLLETGIGPLHGVDLYIGVRFKGGDVTHFGPFSYKHVWEFLEKGHTLRFKHRARKWE